MLLIIVVTWKINLIFEWSQKSFFGDILNIFSEKRLFLKEKD
jgi:hypothetical protein